MKYLFYLGHPAHFHLFKNTIRFLNGRGNKTFVLIKKKDVLEDLVQAYGIEYQNLLPAGRKGSFLGIASGLFKQDLRLLRFCLKTKPDLLLGSVPQIAHVGSILGIPSVNLSEDDAAAIHLYAKITYPFSTIILSPRVCNNGRWDRKTIKHDSYHELAYLHPDNFEPDYNIVLRYINDSKPFFVLRLSGLSAYHDAGVRGLGHKPAAELINMLSPYGRVLISSEKQLSPVFENYRSRIKPEDMHHMLAFAKMYIGDSQTMAAEAGVLGTPFIRVNDFVGRLGYLNELELKYELGYGIKPDKIHAVFQITRSLLTKPDITPEWNSKRMRMLAEKVDFASYLNSFLLEWPLSRLLKQA